MIGPAGPCDSQDGVLPGRTRQQKGPHGRQTDKAIRFHLGNRLQECVDRVRFGVQILQGANRVSAWKELTMKCMLSLLVAVVVWCSLGNFGVAQDRAAQQPASGTVADATAAANWTCPWGGPGMGFGRGPAWSGTGRGQGVGRGLGWGAGAARGPGGGQGRGFGPGAGWGRGGGPAFVDEDHDGVCDNYELRHGMHK
jgi:hypothetical protein